MIGLCRGELPLGCFVLSQVHHAGRGSLSSKPWNKAVDFSKLTKYCDSFRFLKLFCVHFCWEGTFTLITSFKLIIKRFLVKVNHYFLHKLIFGNFQRYFVASILITKTVSIAKTVPIAFSSVVILIQ